MSTPRMSSRAINRELKETLAQLNEAVTERDKYRADSVTLNSVAYRVAEALSDTKGAEQYVGRPIEQVERLIAERDALLNLRDAAIAAAPAIKALPLGPGASEFMSLLDAIDAAVYALPTPPEDKS